MLEKFEPKDVFYWFEELSKIPRCSRQEKKVSDFLVDFAKKRNLEVYQDHENNVIIKKQNKNKHMRPIHKQQKKKVTIL